MYKKILIFVLLVGLGLVSCDKQSPGDEYDFSNAVSPYVTLDNEEDIFVEPDSEAGIVFRMRSALQEKVELIYNASGAINLSNQKVAIERNRLTAEVKLTIPASTPTPSEIKVAIVSAKTEKGTELRIGQVKPENEYVIINVVDEADLP